MSDEYARKCAHVYEAVQERVWVERKKELRGGVGVHAMVGCKVRVQKLSFMTSFHAYSFP